jgi:hypothetical protein
MTMIGKWITITDDSDYSWNGEVYSLPVSRRTPLSP